jgi:hypothetical protein
MANIPKRVKDAKATTGVTSQPSDSTNARGKKKM